MNISFAEGMEIGRKIWNLDNAIWTLQGRHRDMVQFSEYIYKTPSTGFLLNFPLYLLPGRENSEWKYIECMGKRNIDREKFEQWKTLYYELEGWDPASGHPSRSTLKSLDLGDVAVELERNGKLGHVN